MANRRAALRMMLGASAAIAAPMLAKAGTPQGRGRALYRDARAPVPDRVRDLIGRMTLEEKVMQMIALWATKSEIMNGMTFDPAKASSAYPDGFGQLTRASDKRGVAGVAGAAGATVNNGRTPAQTVAFINAMQDWATKRTRLGIPVLVHEESLHGYMANEATMFPQAIALAGSFDRDLMRRVQGQIAREARARGVPFVLSPVVDIVRDPRWGRIEETFGEDPYLVGEMGVAAVEGLQGTGKGPMLPPGKVFATLKHMTGHGQPEAGNNVAPAQISERELRENFFPPFREVVERTGIAAVMPSYNEIDGIPSHGNRWLLDGVLRGEWGFDGVIVSDYGAVAELATLHHVATDKEDAARQALAAGVDWELPDGEGFRTLVAQVRAGKVEQALIDRAVERILAFKFRAGLFENPYGDLRTAQRVTGNAEARALALEAARKSLCLLKNDGMLPLARSGGTVAVIGPNAAVARLGGYSSVPKQTVSLLEGVRAIVGRGRPIVHAEGVRIVQSEDRSADEVLLADPAANRALIAQAVEVARGAEVIVLAIGDTEQTSREAYARNHLGDRTELDLVGEQNELFAALKALGKPIVVTALNGRPPSWPSVVAGANAILECWYVGQEGGTAIAEGLFGIVNPGAKLPVTVVRNAGQVPFYYNHKPTARRGYLFDDASPLFPFGHGLSYSRFEIGTPVLSSPRIAADGEVRVEVEVANVGDRAGDEVVQLYIRRRSASVTQPVLELKGFERVTLAAGERRRVGFTLGTKAFRLWNRELKEVVEPGEVEILAGASSAMLKGTALTIG
ncbi:glycoside hydrolase family 3 N-terminal domain-containing protein [Sphingomonas sp. Y38-1Y]|uniref:glycoside hydrolase family 3 N-terminal domain-containing protein n=1 Tax=Sphingomonas sp. Y38-1Y TaxID=3078265 RepID=UPI0028E1BBC9|nr:glycoside hydrolase family 3 N-terminal domain-containing protein [Sphingomonas sp. Y38-1Y]